MKYQEHTAWSFLSLLSRLRLRSLCPRTALPSPIESPVRASPKGNRVLRYRSPDSIPLHVLHKIHTCAAANGPRERPSFATFHVRLALYRLYSWRMSRHHNTHECLSSRQAQTFST